MPQGARTYTVTVSATSFSSADIKAEVEEPSMDDSRAGLTVQTVDTTRTYDIPGLFNGTFNWTLVPTTAGNTTVTQMNTVVENGEEMTYVIDQVGTGTAAPSTDNPRWRLKGYPMTTVGGPVSHGELRKYPISHTLSSVEYDVGGGYVVHNG